MEQRREASCRGCLRTSADACGRRPGAQSRADRHVRRVVGVRVVHAVAAASTRSSTRAPAASPRATRRTNSGERLRDQHPRLQGALRPRAAGSCCKDFHNCSACANASAASMWFPSAAGGSGACVEAGESTRRWRRATPTTRLPLGATGRCRRTARAATRRRRPFCNTRARATPWRPPAAAATAAACGARTRACVAAEPAAPAAGGRWVCATPSTRRSALGAGHVVTPSAPTLYADDRAAMRRVRRRAPTRMPTRPGRAARRWCTCSARRAPRATRRAPRKASSARRLSSMPPRCSTPSPRSAHSAPPRWARGSTTGSPRTFHSRRAVGAAPAQ